MHLLKALTSPQPFAEVTRRKAKFMFPPPFPLCVEREPERMAVSEVVKGAYESRDGQYISPMTVLRSGPMTYKCTSKINESKNLLKERKYLV